MLTFGNLYLLYAVKNSCYNLKVIGVNLTAIKTFPPIDFTI